MQASADGLPWLVYVVVVAAGLGSGWARGHYIRSGTMEGTL